MNLLRKIFSKDNSTVSKSMICFSIASWITAGIGFLIIPISTRLFSPDELGKINLFNSAISILYPIFCIGLDHGYIRDFNVLDTDSRKKLWTKSFLVSVVLIVCGFFVALFFRAEISNLLIGQNDDMMPIFLMISLLSYTIERYILIEYRLRDIPGVYTLYAIGFTFSNKILFLCSAFFWTANFHSALIITCIANVIMLIVCIVLFRKKFYFKKITHDNNDIKSAFLFGWPIMLVVFISLFAQNIPKFFLKEFVNLSAVGVFSSAITIASIITIAQSGFALVWTPYVYSHYQNEKDNIDAIHKYIVLLITFIAIIIVLFQDLIVLLLGEPYREITYYLPILLITPVCSLLGEITGIGINIERKTKWHILSNLVGVIVVCILCIVLIPTLFELGAALASFFATLSVFIFRSVIGCKYYVPVKNFKYIIISLLSLILISIINCVCFNNKPVAYIFYTPIIFYLIYVFRKEITKIFQLFLSIGKR